MSFQPRRNFIKQSAAWLLLLLGPFARTKNSLAASAAERFKTETFAAALTRLFNDRPIAESELIKLNLPEIAENGAVVPVTIGSELENISRIYLLVEKNPTPLAAEFTLTPMAAAKITARIKMAESCQVIVIAEHNGQLLKTQRWVNVTQGGCGTG